MKDLVYRCPGPHQCENGSFAYHQVKSQQELDEALSNGWHRSLPAARGLKQTTAAPRFVDEPTAEPDAEVIGDDDIPPRHELEDYAKELKLKFTKKTSDKDLYQMILKATDDGLD